MSDYLLTEIELYNWRRTHTIKYNENVEDFWTLKDEAKGKIF